MSEIEEIQLLYKKLEKNSKIYTFPKVGKVKASNKRGVYIIYNPDKSILHVGRTPSGKNGINQRLYNHMTGASSFYKNYLMPSKISLRNGCMFRYIEVEDPRKRALLESLAIGKLCPAHLGISEKEENIGAN